MERMFIRAIGCNIRKMFLPSFRNDQALFEKLIGTGALAQVVLYFNWLVPPF
jgi:hypothetical protein